MSDYGEAHWLLKNLQLWCAPPVIARDEAIFALCLCEARSNLYVVDEIASLRSQ